MNNQPLFLRADIGVVMNNLLSKKQAIIAKIQENFKNTQAEHLDYSKQNIEECSRDLDSFIQNLNGLNANDNIQESIAKEIKGICEKLSTFNNPIEEEYPEYAFGFLYGETGEDIVKLIVETAFYAGFNTPKITPLKTTVFSLQHGRYSLLRIYVGESEENDMVLEYDRRNKQFFFDETPYYDPTFLPIFNLSLNKNHDELSFEVLLRGEYTRYILMAQNEMDKVWFNLIFNIHYQKISFDNPQNHYVDIRLLVERGIIYEIDVKNYNDKGNIIPSSSQESGLWLFTKAIDENGKTEKVEIITDPDIILKELPHLKDGGVIPPKMTFSEPLDEEDKVNEIRSFVIRYPKWRKYELDLVMMKDNIISLISKDKEYFTNENNDVVFTVIEPKTFDYLIKTYPEILKFLQDIFKLQQPFISKYLLKNRR